MSALEEFAAALAVPEHREFFDYWRSKASGGKLPSRQDIDPIEVPRLLPWIILYEVAWQDDKPRFKFRLVGTGNVQRYGRDATGQWFEDVYSGDILARQLAIYGTVASTGRPHLSHPTLPVADKEHVTYHRLILPLATDGVTVDGLAALMIFDR